MGRFKEAAYACVALLPLVVGCSKSNDKLLKMEETVATSLLQQTISGKEMVATKDVKIGEENLRIEVTYGSGSCSGNKSESEGTAIVYRIEKDKFPEAIRSGTITASGIKGFCY